MTFTEEDAENDGLIKREVGKQMVQVAKTNNPEVFEHFENVAENKGRDPANIFGEMVLNALESQDYADKLLDAEISMQQLRADEIRLEDVEYVQQLTEKLGLNESEDSRDPIDQLIDQRLESITQSPVPRLNNDSQVSQGNDEKVAQHMEMMSRKIDNLESKIDEDDQSSGGSESGDEEKSIDDLFGGDGESEKGDVGSGGEEADEPVEVGDTGEQDGEDEEGSGGGDSSDDEGAEELLSPEIGGDFDEVVNADQRETEAEEDDGGEEEADNDTDGEGEEFPVSSEEAEEE